MPLLIASAGIGLASAGMKYFGGKSQEKAGKKALANLNKPVAEIPQEYLDALSEAEKRQVMGLRPEQKAEWVKNMQRSQQTALKASADRKGGLLGIQESANQQTDAATNLIAMDAAAYEENRQLKEQQKALARTNIANWKQNQYNQQMQQYQQGVDSANAMIGAGKQNQFGAFGDIANTALGIGSTMYTANKLAV